MRAELGTHDPLAELRDRLPAAFPAWSPLHRAAYLEMTTLLSPYLLSSQGDRVSLAHAVEGRHPFLDHRLFELAARLPERSKLRGLREKDILRRWSRGVIPDVVTTRGKQPYRAPDVPSFLGAQSPDYVRDLLSPRSCRDGRVLRRAGRRGPAATLRMRAGDRFSREPGIRRHPLHAAVAPALRRRLRHRAGLQEPADVWLDVRPHAGSAQRLPFPFHFRDSAMSLTPPEIREQVRGYLRDNLLYMRPDYVLHDHTRLLEERVIDSMGVMELIGFLEQQFGITIPDKEVTEANLGSVDAITAYVARRFETAGTP